jgi:PIN domain nuclease of toxin-antitoxin system
MSGRAPIKSGAETILAEPGRRRQEAPFDRLLIARGVVETVPLLSVDAVFDDDSATRRR